MTNPLLNPLLDGTKDPIQTETKEKKETKKYSFFGNFFGKALLWYTLGVASGIGFGYLALHNKTVQQYTGVQNAVVQNINVEDLYVKKLKQNPVQQGKDLVSRVVTGELQISELKKYTVDGIIADSPRQMKVAVMSYVAKTIPDDARVVAARELMGTKEDLEKTMQYVPDEAKKTKVGLFFQKVWDKIF